MSICCWKRSRLWQTAKSRDSFSSLSICFQLIQTIVGLGKFPTGVRQLC